MYHTLKKALCLPLALLLAASLAAPALAAGVTYMPGVTPEMSDASYWADRQAGAQEVLLTLEEIKAFNADTAAQSGTMVMDLRQAAETFDGLARIEALRTSSTADAQYYLGWTYGGNGEKAEWPYFEEMIENCADPAAAGTMPVRYGVAVERTVLQAFPSDGPIWDDPNDPDFNYQALSGVRVNEPLLLYLTSADGKYYQARSSCCSGWVSVEDVAVCADREEWLSAWDLPSEKLLVVYGNKEYTDASNSHPETARRMLTQGTALELADGLEADELVGNRSPYHNYAVYLPVRREDGTYEKKPALIPETARVSVGYLPLTMENIAMAALNNLGDAYGWGGMMEDEDCSGMVRAVYACFGMDLARNTNWQWAMNTAKIDMTHMSLEEKCLVLDQMPLGAVLGFPGHEMLYLGKVDGNYYVISSVSSIMSPDTGRLLRTRDVMINTLEVKRASGMSWLGAMDKVFVPAWARLEGKSDPLPALQWYHDGVAWCLENGALPALDIDGTFGIGNTVSRSELAQALWTLAEKPGAEGEHIFSDVPEEHPAYAAIAWAAEAAALLRFERTRETPADVTESGLDGFADAGAASEYALPALRWACSASLLSGSGGYLLPGEALTREQLAAILFRYDALPREELPEQEGSLRT